MKANNQNWSENEFRSYLLLYAAHADLKMTDEERRAILARVTHADLKHVRMAFDNDNDFTRIDTILSFRNAYFPTQEHVDKLLAQIKEVIFADNTCSTCEQSFMNLIHKLLKS